MAMTLDLQKAFEHIKDVTIDLNKSYEEVKAHDVDDMEDIDKEFSDFERT